MLVAVPRFAGVLFLHSLTKGGHMRIAIAVLMLFAASVLVAQTVSPSSLTIVAVPGYSSSPQNVQFLNTGSDQIRTTVSTTGPFVLSENRCGNQVEPKTHCDVSVLYIPKTIGATDTGTLVFTFNNQTVSVPLTGNGVSIIPTSVTNAVYGKGKIRVTLSADGDILPPGEEVRLQCIDYEGVNSINGSGKLGSSTCSGSSNNTASIKWTGPICSGPGCEKWECSVAYDGDAEFAGSGYGPFSFTPTP
jgi:hypothetical protein